MTGDQSWLIAQLEEDIVFGRRRPRERLIEDELVEEFGAKKHVVRDALAELERMGLVERKRNKGASVRDYSPEEVRQIFAVRAVLEAEAARQIPLPVEGDLIETLNAVQSEHDEAVETSDLARAFRVNIRFHQTLFEACGNPYLVKAINDFAFKTHGIRSYSLADPDLLQKAREDHHAIIRALADGKRERLIALCTAHLGPPVQAYTAAYKRTVGQRFKRSA
jgi:DNA-binding GntR family transcriptional regulator